MNNFKDQLKYSYEDPGVFEEAYKRYFPGYVGSKFVENKDEQYRGIDKILFMRDGRQISVDEKKRGIDYGDILLEIFSNDKSKRLGWSLTAESEYICYYVVPIKTFYFMRVLEIRKWIVDNGEDIKKVLKGGNVKNIIKVVAKNPGYNTISIAVKTQVLESCLTEFGIVKLIENIA